MPSTRLRLPVALALCFTLAVVSGTSVAQTVQYRAADGRTFQSLPDTGAIRAAARAYRRSQTLTNALALGAAQSNARQYREAIATYTEALRRWPDAAVLYRWRGHRHLTTRDFIRAREDLEIAIELDSTLYGAWYHLGVVQFVDGEFDAAAAAFRRGIVLAPDAAERAGSTDWLWQSLARAGRTAAADSLLRARPDSVPAGNAYETRLRLYRGQIGPDGVLGSADTAAIQRATLSFGVASWYLARKMPAQAREWFARAADASDGWPSFGAIATEAELAGRTSWAAAVHTARTAAPCIAAITASELRPLVVRAVLSWPSGPEPSVALRTYRDQIALLFQEVSATFRRELGAAPDSLPRADARFDWRQLEGTIVITGYRDGRLTAHVRNAFDGATESQQAAVLAIVRAFDAKVRADPMRATWPSDHASESIAAEVTLGSSDPTPRDATSRVWFPIFSLFVPMEIPVGAIPQTGVPRYPDAQRSRGVVGAVIFEFVVNDSGHIAMETVRERWTPGVPRQRGASAADYDAFRRAVLRAMPEMRFRPSTIAGCAVPMAVRQPFVFALSP